MRAVSRNTRAYANTRYHTRITLVLHNNSVGGGCDPGCLSFCQEIMVPSRNRLQKRFRRLGATILHGASVQRVSFSLSNGHKIMYRV